jgi:hypothetical protein
MTPEERVEKIVEIAWDIANSAKWEADPMEVEDHIARLERFAQESFGLIDEMLPDTP